MHVSVPEKRLSDKERYETPQMEVVLLAGTDVITTSESGDDNQGEWDPQ